MSNQHGSMPPPPPPYGGPPQNDNSTLILVMGILGLVLGPLFGVIGLVLGHKAKKEGNTDSKVQIGFILSAISVGLWLLGIISAIACIGCIGCGTMFL